MNVQHTILGSIFRQRRESRLLTQKQLANVLDIDQSMLSRIEAGRSTPDFFLAERYAKALAFLPGEFLVLTDAVLDKTKRLVFDLCPGVSTGTWIEDALRVSGEEGLRALVDFAVSVLLKEVS